MRGEHADIKGKHGAIVCHRHTLPLHRLFMGSVCLWHTMGPGLPSMSACSPRNQLLPTPYPSWHGPSSTAKQAFGSPSFWYNTATITQLLLSLQCATMLADQLPALPQSCNPKDWAVKRTQNPMIKAWLLPAGKIKPACRLPLGQSPLHREHMSRLTGYVGC